VRSVEVTRHALRGALVLLAFATTTERATAGAILGPESGAATTPPDGAGAAPAQGGQNLQALNNNPEFLNQVVAGLFSAGQYAEAREMARRVLALTQKKLGKNDPATAMAMTSLGAILVKLGEFQEAEALEKGALAVRKKRLGARDPLTANSLENLGALYWAMADYRKAESYYKEAHEILEKSLGPDHADTAMALGNLADLYNTMGEYRKAEALFLRARAVLEKHPEVSPRFAATLLMNLGYLHYAQGEFDKAEPLYLRALEIRQKTLGEEHPDVALVLNNLAALYRGRGDYPKAQALLLRAVSILEPNPNSEVPSNPEVAVLVGNLATLYMLQQDYANALRLLEGVLKAHEKQLGPSHRYTAVSLSNLAMLHFLQGNHALAEKLYRRALDICDKQMGPEHPDTAVALSSLATVKAALGQDAVAAQLWERSALAREKFLARELPAKSERDRLSFMETLAGETSGVIAWCLRLGSAFPPARRLALQMLLQRKGRVLDLSRETLGLLRQRATPADRQKLDKLQELRRELASLTFAGSTDDRTSHHLRERREELAARADAVEGELGGRFADLRPLASGDTLKAVQARVGEGKALIEIATFRPWPAGPRAEPQHRGQPHYAAFVLRGQGEPQAVDLGERAPLDALVAEWLAAIQGRQEGANELGRRLHARLVAPLRAALNGARDIWISPEGSLNSVPWAALVDEDGAFLVSTHRLTYLTSGRDLLRLGQADKARGASVVMGAPAYDAEEAGAPPPGRHASGLTFTPLPNTEAEARQVGALFGVKPYLGAEAREAILKDARQPRIVHLATHGFFLAQPTASRPEAEIRGFALSFTPGLNEPPSGPVENPLLLSGVALAGANGAGPGPDDGLLYALEVAALDLRGTKLVVLSACQTGLGASVDGEGLFGLRRALVLAGSESQVLSLWRVQDDTTASFMTALHGELAKGAARVDALRTVQRALLKAGRTAHPYFWAPFFLQGDPSSLDGAPPASL
jgi:CHAT domain-containing protein/tetratricopeptide (TPR) repeat protein